MVVIGYYGYAITSRNKMQIEKWLFLRHHFNRNKSFRKKRCLWHLFFLCVILESEKRIHASSLFQIEKIVCMMLKKELLALLLALMTASAVIPAVPVMAIETSYQTVDKFCDYTGNDYKGC
jgi:hypothetical protein